ncbi:MAG: tetratricopeptide repeat protein [Deltaproteobacteria bacterium]|nr:tetratricopeptide repeat protein [Deltaproteobacteria bacterium]
MRWVCIFVIAVVITACKGDGLDEVHALHEAGQYLESLELLEEWIEDHPDDPEAHYLYGVASVRTGRASLGLFSLRRARDFEGWEVKAGLELARAGLASGDNAAAIDAATQVLTREPDSVVALTIRAEAHSLEKDYEAALADAERVRAADPRNGEIELLRLRTLVGLRRLEEAQALFDELEARREAGEVELPEGRYCATRAIFAAESGEKERAAEIFDVCLERHSESAIVIEQALEFYDGQEDSDRSRTILEHALAEEPSRVPLREHLAARLRKAGEIDEAERLLREGTELEPAMIAAMAWRGLAWHFFELDDFAGAALAWSEFMALVPTPGDESVMAWSEALALSGQYDEALEVAKGLPEASQYMARGRIFLEQRLARPALESFERGLRLWPDNPVAHYYAARAAEHAGDFGRAISEYRHSVRANAGATDAGLRLGRLYMVERRYQPARVALGHHQREHPNDPEVIVLAYRLAIRLGDEKRSQSVLRKLSRMPGQRGRSIAEAANALAATENNALAINFLLRTTETLDFAHPDNAEALRSLITRLALGDRSEAARMWARRSVKAHPGAARPHELLGLALEQTGAPPDEARRSYEKAVELDPDDAYALHALARMQASGGDIDAALAFYDRATDNALRPEHRSQIALDAVQLSLSEGRTKAAESRLEELLWHQPINGAAAALLSDLLLERDPASARGLSLSHRAARFGRRRGGSDDAAGENADGSIAENADDSIAENADGSIAENADGSGGENIRDDAAQPLIPDGPDSD